MRIRYQKTVLDNNLRVLSEKIDSVRSITLGIWVDVGSRDEDKGESGISHLIEHMLFKGTKNRTAKEISLSLESVGGILNAFTGRENTCFFAKVTEKHLEIALDVLSDLILNPLFNPGDFKKEKKVIAQEIKDLEDNPSETIFDLLMQVLWGDHPLGRPVIGTLENILSLEKNQVVDFMRENYTVQRIVIAASGNLSHRRLIDLVKTKFRLPDNITRTKSKIQPLKPLSLKKVFFKKTAQVHICLGFPGYPYNHSQRYPTLLLGNILGGGMSSRLFQNLREKFGLAYNIHSFIDFFRDKGVFGIYLGTDKKQVIQAITQVLKELNRIKKEKLSKKELENAKNQLKGNLILSAESTSSRMNRLALLELYLGEYISLERTIHSINKVKAKDISEAANELLDGSRLVAAILGPVNQKIIQKINWNHI